MTSQTERLPLFLISGATATGKTSTSIEIACALTQEGKQAEILNGDSLLFYPEISIGTAKPTAKEKKNIPHHLIDCSSISTPLNANDYMTRALAIIGKLHQENKVPIIVGGSAFYIRALMKGMYEGAKISPEVSLSIEKLEQTGGWEEVRNKLKDLDPQSFDFIHNNDRYRTIRALEFCLATDRPFSSERLKNSNPYDFSQLQNKQWKLFHIYLSLPKEQHWKIMEKRANKMIEQGLVEEVQELLENGHSSDLKPLQSIGYKETIAYLNGDLPKEELVERIYINTRKLAKSQKTFFNKITPKNTYNPIDQKQDIIDESLHFLKTFEG